MGKRVYFRVAFRESIPAKILEMADDDWKRGIDGMDLSDYGRFF